MEKKEVANEPQREVRSTAIKEYRLIDIKDEPREVQPSLDSKWLQESSIYHLKNALSATS